MTTYVRRLRHWKQRFNPGAKFIWRSNVLWQGKRVKPGDPVPQELNERTNRGKLRRLWEAGVICLAEFDVPDVVTGRAPVPSADGPIKEGSQWVVPGTDQKFTSKKKALEWLEAQKEEKEKAESEKKAADDDSTDSSASSDKDETSEGGGSETESPSEKEEDDGGF